MEVLDPLNTLSERCGTGGPRGTLHPHAIVPPVLSDELIDLLREQPGGMLCTRDAEKHPAIHHCYVTEVHADHLVGLVPLHMGRDLRQNVEDNGEFAFVVARASGDHRSLQIKGKIAKMDPAVARPEPFRRALEHLLPAFTRDLKKHAARALLREMAAAPVYRVCLDIAQVFDQTPGPDAGRRIGGGE